MMDSASIHISKIFAYTMRDARRRVFRQWGWPDMFRLLPEFNICRADSPWIDVLLREYSKRVCTVPGLSDDTAQREIISTMFGPDYCSVPCDYDELQGLMDGRDLEVCLNMAIELAGLNVEPQDIEPDAFKSREEFDIDECVGVVMRDYSYSWDDVHSLTWRRLQWCYEQAMLQRLKHDAPLHGIDTSKIVRDIERRKQADIARRKIKETHEKGEKECPRDVLATLPVGKLSEEDGNKLWDALEKESNEFTPYSEEKVEQMKKVNGLLTG